MKGRRKINLLTREKETSMPTIEFTKQNEIWSPPALQIFDAGAVINWDWGAGAGGSDWKFVVLFQNGSPFKEFYIQNNDRHAAINCGRFHYYFIVQDNKGNIVGSAGCPELQIGT
jgi:hypothetical protein